MRIVDLVEQQRLQLGQHPLLRRLDAEQEPYDRVRRIPGLLSFVVLSGPDLVDTLADGVRDPVLADALRAHPLRTAAGEDGPADLFGPAHAIVRRATHALLSEAVRAEGDGVRLALLVSAGAALSELAARLSAYPHAASARPLVFGPYDDPELRLHLAAYTFSRGEYCQAVEAVERAFDAFRRMFDGVRTDVCPFTAVPRRRAS